MPKRICKKLLILKKKLRNIHSIHYSVAIIFVLYTIVHVINKVHSVGYNMDYHIDKSVICMKWKASLAI